MLLGGGDATAELAARLGEYGAAKVYAADAPEFGAYLVVPKVDALEQIARAVSPAAVLVTSSGEGKEIAARLALRLGSGIITDAVDLQAGPDGPVATQSVFAASYTVRSAITHGTPVITVKPNTAAPEPAPAAGTVENVTVALPRGKLVVLTGPSGSGKSSLAFDTIYAEGQRRYVESLSAYARQFLEQLAKPNVERIDGLIVTARRSDKRPPVGPFRHKLPVVYVFSQADDPNALSLVPDDEGGARLAVAHLAGLGRRRIAYVTGPERFEAVRLRHRGYERGLAEAGLTADPSFYLSGIWAEEWGRDAVARGFPSIHE